MIFPEHIQGARTTEDSKAEQRLKPSFSGSKKKIIKKHIKKTMATKPKLAKLTAKPKNTMLKNMVKNMIPKKPSKFEKLTKVKPSKETTAKMGMNKFAMLKKMA